MTSRKNSCALSNVLKVIAARECCQNLTGDEAELLCHDNNDCKTKHDCLKKLSISDS